MAKHDDSIGPARLLLNIKFQYARTVSSRADSCRARNRGVHQGQSEAKIPSELSRRYPVDSSIPKMHLDLMTGRHMVIKTLLMQNLSYAHYLSALHNTIQNLYDISPPTKVLPPCFCCPYACLLACTSPRLFQFLKEPRG